MYTQKPLPESIQKFEQQHHRQPRVVIIGAGFESWKHRSLNWKKSLECRIAAGKAISLDQATFDKENAQKLFALTEAMLREQDDGTRPSPRHI
jgi:hypothetical protein